MWTTSVDALAIDTSLANEAVFRFFSVNIQYHSHSFSQYRQIIYCFIHCMLLSTTCHIGSRYSVCGRMARTCEKSPQSIHRRRTSHLVTRTAQIKDRSMGLSRLSRKIHPQRTSIASKFLLFYHNSMKIRRTHPTMLETQDLSSKAQQAFWSHLRL